MPKNKVGEIISNRKTGRGLQAGHFCFFFRILEEHYTQILIHLDHEALSPDEFMRGLLEGYLSRDPDFMAYWFKFKEKFAKEIIENPKRLNRAALFDFSCEAQRQQYKKGLEKEAELDLTDEERDSIFDDLERK